MDYPVKTLGQLQPVLRGFRKAAGLTQAMMAARLGITQQSYAQFEANPAAAGVERLFKVLRLLNAGITLRQDEPSPANTAPVAKMAPSNRTAAAGQDAAKAVPRKGAARHATTRATPVLKASKRAQSGATAPDAARTAPRNAAPAANARAAARPGRMASPPKKREQW